MVEEHDAMYVTFARVSCNPGDSVIQATMVPKIRRTPYMIRVDVDDLHEGHAEQQRLQAALPQQQAS
jgi:hypothetical protein